MLPNGSSKIAASACGNIYAQPGFLDTTYNRFELRPTAAALDKGNPIMAMRDRSGVATSPADGPRNNIGDTGGRRISPVEIHGKGYGSVC